MRAHVGSASVLAAALLAGPAFAGSEGSATFGGQWWTQSAPEAKFQEFRQVPRGGFLEEFLLGQWQDEGPWSGRLWGANALQRDQRTGLSLAHGVRWRLDAGYVQNPHRFSQVAISPYAEIAPGVFALPDSLQSYLQNNAGQYNAVMRDLLGNAPGIGLGTRTNVATARLRARPAQGWTFELRGTQRQREGHQAFGMPFGFNSAVEVAAPVSHRTVDADAVGGYARGPVRVQASVGLSQFENRVSTLIVDNPKRITDRAGGTFYTGGDGSVRGRSDLAPDNRVVRGHLAMSARLPRASTITATVGVSRADQDDDFLPFAFNSAIPQASLDSLPARSADARVVTTTQDYRLTSRAIERVTGTLRFNHVGTDNQTPELEFIGRSRMDQTWTPGVLHNHHFGLSRSVLGADVGIALADWASLTLLAEHRARTHHDREVEKDKESVFGGGLSLQPVEDMAISGSYRRGQRELDAFDVSRYELSGALAEWPQLRRFDVADRNQDQAQASVTWSPDRRVDVSVEYTYGKDDYTNSFYGLKERMEQMVQADVTLRLPRGVDLSGGYGFGDAEAFQQSIQSNGPIVAMTSPGSNWTAKLTDENVFVYTRAEWWAMPRRLRLLADYTFSRALGEYELRNDPGNAVDLPGTLYRRHDLQFEARWRMRYDLDLAGRYGYDNYDVIDFAAQNVPALGQGTTLEGPVTAIYLGDFVQGYRAHRMALVASRRF